MTEPAAALLRINTADRRTTLYALYIVAIHCSDSWLADRTQWRTPCRLPACSWLPPSNEYTVRCCAIAGVSRCLYVHTWPLPALRNHRDCKPESWHRLLHTVCSTTFTPALKRDFRARLELPPTAVQFQLIRIYSLVHMGLFKLRISSMILRIGPNFS